jgi:hypothetical protein
MMKPAPKIRNAFTTPMPGRSPGKKFAPIAIAKAAYTAKSYHSRTLPKEAATMACALPRGALSRLNELAPHPFSNLSTFRIPDDRLSEAGSPYHSIAVFSSA